MSYLEMFTEAPLFVVYLMCGILFFYIKSLFDKGERDKAVLTIIATVLVIGFIVKKIL